ncbi:MAG: single-strand binding protein single-strand DNA-binding protein [Candidatus Nomurabacteria bacterium]|nr:single-strand binding protein single-strand DNA-binding protein [Candidatus Nomurabacteria bacterium]
MYLNKVFLIGNLTRDPEIKALPSGSKVASISLATNRVWKDQAGARQEATEYHNTVAFGRQAENLAQYAKKGASLFVEGRIQTRSWDGQDGKKNYRTEIIIDSFQFGPKAGGFGDAAPRPSASGVSDAEAPQKSAPADLDTIEYPDEEINLEDIPF